MRASLPDRWASLRRLLPYRNVAPAFTREGLTFPATPPFAQRHSSESCHQIQFGRPHIAERRRKGLKFPVHHPVVMGVRVLRRDIIFLEPEMCRGHLERVDGLARRQTLQLRNVVLDDKAAARFQMRGDVAEAL